MGRAGERRVNPQRLETFCALALRQCGVSDEDSRLTARVMIRTNLRGIDSHGIRRLPVYVERLKAGGINPAAEFQVVEKSVTTATIEANAGLGQAMAYRGVELAISIARAQHVAVVLIRNSHHFGAAGVYALMCAEAGLIGQVFTSAPASMQVTGARGPVIGNGARAYGVPCDGDSIVLDLAMSTAVGAEVQRAASAGEAIPEGWLVDAAGQPSTDPSDFTRGGALMSIGGHKGYGLALVGELIAGILSGAATSSEIGPLPLPASRKWNAGHAFIAIDVEAFQPLDQFKARVREFSDRISNSPKAPGVKRIRIPGHMAAERERKALQNGLLIDAACWDSLEKVASNLEISRSLQNALIASV